MQFYNSLTSRKEEFVPREEGKVYVYLCGITAYDYCHIGHARSAVIFDVLIRFLRYSGYRVHFARNFTDVDDKIINRADEEGQDSEVIAQKFIQAFYEDMEKLNVLTPDYEPKATEHIEDMQDLIEKLLEKGYAYTTKAGDVYFRVRSFPDYGRLSGRNIEELQAGSRIEPGEEKEDPLDFALWKRAKGNELSWSSPWGAGRPGWHIECSAMSKKYLLLPLDIHGGGQDLIFPHHENERAQSIAATGENFVNYWLHNGFVRVQQEKMSKSLGNFVVIRDILQYFHPEVVRFFLLSTHYRSPLDFSWESLQETEKGIKRIYQTKYQVSQVLKNKSTTDASLPEDIEQEVAPILQEWLEPMQDDLNTAATLGNCFNLVRLANRILEDKTYRKSSRAQVILSHILDSLNKAGSVLGLFEQDSAEFLEKLRWTKAKRSNIDISWVEEKIRNREEARKTKDFQRADQIREELGNLGIKLQDTPSGTIWDVE